MSKRTYCILRVALLIIHWVCGFSEVCQRSMSGKTAVLFTLSQSVRWLATDFFTKTISSSFSNSNIWNTGAGSSINVSNLLAQGNLGRSPSLDSLRKWKLGDFAHCSMILSEASGYFLMYGLTAYSPVFLLVRDIQ